MTVVLDSNVVVALVTKEERAAAIAQKMEALGEAAEVLHAPSLLRYEVANALTRKVVVDELDAELLTLDGPLARNAAGTDLPVRLIETT